MFALPRPLQSLSDYGRLADTYSRYSILGAALVGVYSHVLLDSTLYTDARPFFPLDLNPFLLSDVTFVLVYGGCVLAGVLGIVLFAVRY